MIRERALIGTSPGAVLALALLLGAGDAAAQAPHIGRLFTTPLERQRLDSLRAGGAAAASANAAMPTPPPASDAAAVPPPAPPPTPLIVNGIVRRGDGRNTVWINQQVQQGQPVGTAKTNRQPVVTLTLPNGATVLVQPGQQVDPVTGMVRNADPQ
ncbi:MAG TPA: hypothetical protein VFF16_09360 [Telluria sp.]|nr:hypothetical protein [Telluria sp.]